MYIFPPDESQVAMEVWRSRAAMARHTAAALREEARTGVWMAGRQLSYRQWLIAQALRRADPAEAAAGPR
jgi:hypothetical protein